MTIFGIFLAAYLSINFTSVFWDGDVDKGMLCVLYIRDFCSIPLSLEVKSLAAVPSCPVSEGTHQQRGLSPWERKLVAAQNVLFNQELFLQVGGALSRTVSSVCLSSLI